MELFELLGKISIDNADANRALDDTAGKGQQTQGKLSKAFSGIGKGAAVVGKAVGAGMVAGGTAMAGLTVKALNLSGELEQNMGGSEAVFGEYAGKMQETAKNAFGNMGLSTADFLGTANKMGALFQGAGFSIEESSDLASDAMQRAADVASIMGIDTGAAMEAIAGAAKGNFTMMDNLGVAMNDTTIQAYALSKGIKKSTKDMTNQEKIGLAMEMFMEKTAYAAGNYAKENETLAGSLGTAKAALTNFLDGSGDVDQLVGAFTNAANVIVKNVSELAPRLVSGVTDIVNQLIPLLPPLIESMLPVIIDGAFGLVRGLVEALPAMFELIVSVIPDLLYGITDMITEWVLPALVDIFTMIVNTLPTLLPMLIDCVLTMIRVLAYSLVDMIQPIVEALPAIITAIVDTLVEMVPWLIDGCIMLVVAIVEALPTIIQALLDAIPTIINGIVDALILGLPTLIEGFITLFAAIVTALPEIILSLVEAAPTIIAAIVTGLLEAGAALVTAFGDLFTQAKDKVVEVAGTIKDSLSEKWEEVKSNASEKWEEIKTTASEKWQAIKDSAIGQAVASMVETTKAKFDELKANARAKWETMVGDAKTKWESIKSSIAEKANDAKAKATTAWNALKTVTSSAFGYAKESVSSAFSTIKTKVSDGASAAWATVKEKFEGIKNSIKEKIEAARDLVKAAIDKVKGFFDFEFKWPKIPMPHFAVSPSGWQIGDLLTGSIPSLGIAWYAKAMNNAMILDKPSIFGYDAATGKLLGGGEAGSEVVAGTGTLMSMIASAVSANSAAQTERLVAILTAILEAITGGNQDMIQALLSGQSFEIDGREFGRLVKEYA